MVKPLAVTMGDPAGIGGELSIDAWHSAARHALPPFAVLDDPDRLRAIGEAIGRPAPIRPIAGIDEAAELFPAALPVVPVPLPGPVAPGRPDPHAAAAVLDSIRLAVRLTLGGRAAAVVTNPIAKQVLYRVGFRFPGHTEYLAALTAEGTGRPAPVPVMMIAGPSLRVVPLTIHIPYSAVPSALTPHHVVERARIVAAALCRDFGIDRPRLVLAGLNPHAGEGGTIGTEERSLLAPAVAALQAEGIDIRGPVPADTLFHAAARKRYDAALCPTHDQALIPAKTLDFDQGVNVTLGLPFIRTSPDHGTAFDIAGQGVARPDSLIAAIRLAGALAARRAEVPVA